MLFRFLCVLTMALGLPAITTPAAGGERTENQDPAELARTIKTLLKTHCYRCHGVEKEVPGYDVLDVAAMKLTRGDEPAYIVGGKPDDSLLWQRVGIDRDMPPEDSPRRPSEQQLRQIREWIRLGAPAASEEKRAHVSETAILSLIRADLQRHSRADRKHQRYFSLHAAANNTRFDNADLRMQRAALSKLVNSVSRSSQLKLPTAVAARQDASHLKDLVYRIDLRDYGWSVGNWQNAIAGYPYGLVFNDPARRELADDIEQLIGAINSDGVPYFRIDWFVFAASNPPVYHDLIGTPDTAGELEQRLGVDVQRDYQQDRLQRAGFASSGVSRHNRLIDRHIGSRTQYYYKSYDFSKSFGRSLLARYPLGPSFDGNSFAKEFAFEHDGGEIIYSLPNGLQGYMLVDSDGNRIDRGPISIVRDLRETAGTPEIVNGISCIGCHRNGLLEYTNAIDATLTLDGEARSKVSRLFIDHQQMDQLLGEDQERFLSALKKVVGPFLQVDEDADKDIRSFAEPVRVVVGWYNRDITLADAAADLNIQNPNELAATIRTNTDLLSMGLGPLAIGQTAPRRMWDTLEESSASVFQRTAVAIRIGTGIGLSGN